MVAEYTASMSNQIETIIEYQLENRNRKTVFWRGILAFPVVLFLASFSEVVQWGWTGGYLLLPTLLAIVFTGKYPSYILNFNHGLLELETRLTAYVLLLTDDYPSIERNPKIAILLPDVDGGKKLGRILQIFKIIFVIPLVIVGLFYAIGAIFVTFVAWINTWSTGTYPKWALDYILGTIAFWNRIYGYALLLVTDEYPRFTL
jgi:TRAP-type mannitol/chloroaromatic compound transport system permease small subunit